MYSILSKVLGNFIVTEELCISDEFKDIFLVHESEKKLPEIFLDNIKCQKNKVKYIYNNNYQKCCKYNLVSLIRRKIIINYYCSHLKWNYLRDRRPKVYLLYCYILVRLKFNRKKKTYLYNNKDKNNSYYRDINKSSYNKNVNCSLENRDHVPVIDRIRKINVKIKRWHIKNRLVLVRWKLFFFITQK